MRPIDMHIAVGTLPDHARAAGMEQAGAVYRSLQDMAEARNENLTRPARIAESPQAQQGAFQTIAQGQPDLMAKLRGLPGRNEIEQYRKRKEQQGEPLTYNPKGKSADTFGSSGTLLNISA